MPSARAPLALILVALGTAGAPGRAAGQEGAAPSVGAVAAALRGPGTPEVESLDPPRPLGGGRFMAVAAVARSLSSQPRVILAVVSDSAGSARVHGSVVLPTPRIAAELYSIEVQDRGVSDYDGDGAIEAMVQLVYYDPAEPAVGATAHYRYYVVDFSGPSPRVAANVEFATDPQAEVLPHREGTVSLSDLNGDGHADIVVRGQNCDEGPGNPERICRPFITRYLWDRASDGWAGPRRRGR